MSEVSIILPFKNASATLIRAIRSIQNQSFENWELMAVDDGSVDDSNKQLQRLAREDARIQLIQNKAPGIANALNLGIRQANSPYLARMDADDESHPERLEQQIAFLNENRDIGLVASRVTFRGDRATNLGFSNYVDWTNRLLDWSSIRANRFVESPFAHPSVMFRKNLLKAGEGPYRQGDFPEDYELWLRWMADGVRMAKIGKPLLHWFDSPARLSRNDSRYAPRAFYRIKAKYLAQWLKAESLSKRPVWIWGAGRITRKRARWLHEHGIVFAGYIDIDPKKLRTKVEGLPVISPESLNLAARPFVISYVGNRGARDEIHSELLKMGLREERDFILAA